MEIVDFLPKYPNIYNKDEDILNPYEIGFYESIFKKREFYEERIKPNEIETIPDEKGVLMKHQKIIARFLSSNTMYDSLLLVHMMGTGKTCSAIGAIEQIKSETNNFKGVYIFAKGKSILNNFIKELRDKCTSGQYIPEGYIPNISTCGSKKNKGNGLTEKEALLRTKKLYEHFYHISIAVNKPTTFQTFAKHLKRTNDADIVEMYSNHIIVIDEVHNLRIQGDSNSMHIYEQFKRFLHLVKNCKILLLSGTPMKDSPDEIASIMNLILPKENELPIGEKFLDEYMEKKGVNSYIVKKSTVNKLKHVFKGRVSFIKALQSSVTKEFVGEKNVGKLKHFIVDPIKMSQKQSDVYNKALKIDNEGNKGIYTNSRQASLFVFPDGSYGPVGFAKNVQSTSKAFISSLMNSGQKKKKVLYSYALNSAVIRDIKGKNDKETLENLAKYSPKYAYVIKNILDNPKKCCFVYSELVTGSGSIVFSELLKLFGFSKSKGQEMNPGLRFGLLTSETSSSTQISKIINCFNQERNKHGDIIKVLIGSRIVSEGVSFYNIQQEFILTPWFNYSETDQAISRGHRLNSHKALLDANENPKVHIHQLVSIPLNKSIMSIDLHMYEISEDKDITIKGIVRLIIESSFDCSLTYYRNHITGQDYERDCEYLDCNYKCDGIDMKYIKEGISTPELDESTYKLYYSDPKVANIKKQLDKLFKSNDDFDLETIIKYFEGEYSEWEVKNALSIILKKSEEHLYYSDYVDTYYKSNVKKLMLGIEKLFQTYFYINFDNILKNFPNNSDFELLTALKKIIDESIIIKNKYGFSCYLRENKNIYFLVNSLSIKDDLFSNYYVSVPNIINGKSFTDILYNTQIELFPNLIKIICGLKNPIELGNLIKSIPDEVQEMFIEAAISAEEQNITTNKLTRKLILDYFKNYIFQMKNGWISNRLEEDDVLRCYKNEKWKECENVDTEELEQLIKTRKGILEKNPWGYYGKYNSESGIFSIVNIIEQTKKYEKDRLTKEKKLSDLVKNKKMSPQEMKIEMDAYQPDYRKIYPGKNCLSWSVPLLLNLAVKIFKLDYPDSFKNKDAKEVLIKLAKKNKYINNMYTDEEFKTISNDELRRVLFFVSKSSVRNHICNEIKKWMESQKWDGFDMLIPDSETGIQGGHKKKDKETDEKERPFRIENIIPEVNPDKFKEYLKDIQKLMLECFNIKKYVPEIDSKQWLFIFLRNKLVGYLIIDKEYVISSACIGTNYRRRGIAKKALEKALENVCKIKNPRLILDNKSKTYDKLIKLYTEYGFTLIKKDDKITTMEFKC